MTKKNDKTQSIEDLLGARKKEQARREGISMEDIKKQETSLSNVSKDVEGVRGEGKVVSEEGMVEDIFEDKGAPSPLDRGKLDISKEDITGKREKAGIPKKPEVTKVSETMPQVPETIEESLGTSLDSRTKKKEKVSERTKGEEKIAPSGVSRQTAKATAGPVQVSDDDLQNILNLPQDKQIKMLVEIVMKDGLEKAIETIRKMNEPYLYDLLHDTLVDELYMKLKGPRT
ncbi:MAG: hypothetical protein ACD_63C00093G0003 [uncultured bacterium]|nr:MAG: hypothetical protein ACD_63C00093G0003 [uncultured bacterium]